MATTILATRQVIVGGSAGNIAKTLIATSGSETIATNTIGLTACRYEIPLGFNLTIELGSKFVIL